jgi:hypothetical protein
MKALHTGIALILFASAATAAAQDVNVSAGPWFIGIGGGQSSLHGSCSYAESLSPPATCDDESVAVKAFVGMQVYKYTFLEFSYIDAGEANLVQTATPTGTLDINPRLYNLFLDVEIPLAFGGRLGLLGKFGMTYYDTKFTTTGSFSGIRSSADGVSGAIGAGLTWHGWKHLSMRAEWEHFNDASINNNDLDLATVSLLFHF